MSEQNFQEIADRVDKISKKCEAFSNPVRTLIVSIIVAKGETNWTELKATVEKIMQNGMNPNTLGFHIGKLIEMEYIEKVGTKEQPIYRIAKNNLNPISVYIDPIIVELIKKKALK